VHIFFDIYYRKARNLAPERSKVIYVLRNEKRNSVHLVIGHEVRVKELAQGGDPKEARL